MIRVSWFGFVLFDLWGLFRVDPYLKEFKGEHHSGPKAACSELDVLRAETEAEP